MTDFATEVIGLVREHLPELLARLEDDPDGGLREGVRLVLQFRHERIVSRTAAPEAHPLAQTELAQVGLALAQLEHATHDTLVFLSGHFALTSRPGEVTRDDFAAWLAAKQPRWRTKPTASAVEDPPAA